MQLGFERRQGFPVKHYKYILIVVGNEVFLVMIALIKANIAWFSNVKFLMNIIFADMYDNGNHKLSGVSWDKALDYHRRSVFVFCINYANQFYEYASVSVCYNRIWLYFKIFD